MTFILPLPKPKTMKKSSLATLCIAMAASGLAGAYEMAPSAAVQRVVASIRADVASEFDCVADDDSQRYRTPPAAPVANAAPAGGLAVAEKQNRLRIARVERELRNSLPAR